MRIAIVGLAFGLALGAGAAVAQTSVPPALPANPEPTVTPTAAASLVINDDSIICKYEHTTGTLLMEQVCRTQRAWKLMQAEAQEFMEYGFRGSHQCGSTDCGKSGGGG